MFKIPKNSQWPAKWQRPVYFVFGEFITVDAQDMRLKRDIFWKGDIFTMWFPTTAEHNRHDLCCPATAGEMSRATPQPILCIHRPYKGLWHCKQIIAWDVLSKFGCPPQFLAVLREFHDGMTAKVVMNGRESDPFMVNIGVKQGCVPAPVIFNKCKKTYQFKTHCKDDVISLH